MEKTHNNLREFLKPSEDSVDNPFYGLSRSPIPPVHMDIRFRSGRRRALPYSGLHGGIEMEGSAIRMYFTIGMVIIKGRCLSILYDSLIRIKVTYIAENKDHFFEPDAPDTLVIESIVFEENE